MPKRKGLSNKIRFEVFKRDSFKCQYCGKSAPEVALQVDHINPVARGGKNSITNLVTSCQPCNGGKGAVALDDSSALSKQRAQMEQLNERRAQLTMMMNWREELDSLEDAALENIVADVEARFKCGLSEHGRKALKSCLKRHGMADTQEAIRCCELQYLVSDTNGGFTRDSIHKAIEYIPKVANGIKVRREDPSFSRLMYAMGIVKNRYSHRPFDALKRMRAAQARGTDVEDIVNFAKSSRNWTQFSQLLDGGD